MSFRPMKKLPNRSGQRILLIYNMQERFREVKRLFFKLDKRENTVVWKLFDFLWSFKVNDAVVVDLKVLHSKLP